MNTGVDAGSTRIFSSAANLRESFQQGLAGLLQQDALGAFILVLANGTFERETFERLREPLALAFSKWDERFDRRDEQAIGDAGDDVEVFTRLRRLGFENLLVTRRRRLGPWELQFNQLRAMRPPRMSGAAVDSLHRPFNRDGFHFNKSFLRKEIFWEGDLGGAPVHLLYNKFPFAELHGLLVPHPEANKPQFLSRDDHALIWDIAQQLGQGLPAVGFGYNAYGAFASVNHLHFQMFVRSSGFYPIESGHWLHNGGSEPYPLTVQRHADRASAWDALRDLHEAGLAYNLIYRPGSVYIVVRAMQGRFVHSDWTGGFAWSELAGTVTVSDEVDFERLSQQDVTMEFGRLAVRP